MWVCVCVSWVYTLSLVFSRHSREIFLTSFPGFIKGNIELSGSQVAGAAAAAGLPLEEVAEQARHASKLVGTMGVALSVCTLPGQGTSDRLGPHQMELGLGIVSLLQHIFL